LETKNIHIKPNNKKQKMLEKTLNQLSSNIMPPWVMWQHYKSNLNYFGKFQNMWMDDSVSCWMDEM
jgi:hypothetical protein